MNKITKEILKQCYKYWFNGRQDEIETEDQEFFYTDKANWKTLANTVTGDDLIDHYLPNIKNDLIIEELLNNQYNTEKDENVKNALNHAIYLIDKDKESWKNVILDIFDTKYLKRNKRGH